MLNNDLAYLVGALRDGSVYHDKASRNYYIIWYSKSKSYLEESISTRVKRTFGRNCNVDMYKENQWRCRISGLEIYNMMRNTFEFPPQGVGQAFWPTPVIVQRATLAAKVAFIRGVFDAEGDASIANKYVEASQKNTNLLLWTKEFLETLGIKAGRLVVADNKTLTYKIVIAAKESVNRFARLIGFEHPVKRVQLARLIGTLNA